MAPARRCLPDRSQSEGVAGGCQRPGFLDAFVSLLRQSIQRRTLVRSNPYGPSVTITEDKSVTEPRAFPKKTGVIWSLLVGPVFGSVLAVMQTRHGQPPSQSLVGALAGAGSLAAVAVAIDKIFLSVAAIAATDEGKAQAVAYTQLRSTLVVATAAATATYLWVGFALNGDYWTMGLGLAWLGVLAVTIGFGAARIRKQNHG